MEICGESEWTGNRDGVKEQGVERKVDVVKVRAVDSGTGMENYEDGSGRYTVWNELSM